MMTRRRKRILFWSFLFTPLVAFLGAAIYFVYEDDPHPDDGDLQPVYQEVPDSDNGYLLVKDWNAPRWYHALQDPSREKTEAEYQKLFRIEDVLAGKVWDAGLAQEILDHNRTLLELVDGVLDRPRYKPPPWPKPCKFLPSLEEIAAFRAWALFKQGREQEAFDAALAMVRLGKRMEDSQAHWQAAGLKTSGLEKIREMLLTSKLGPEILKDRIGELETCRQSQKTAINCLKMMYQYIAQSIDDDVSGKSSDFSWSQMSHESIRQAVANSGYCLKSNRTKRLFASLVRQCIQEAGKVFAEMNFEPDQKTSGNLSTGLLSPNSRGNLLFKRYMFSTTDTLAGYCKEQAQFTATQLAIAIRCFKLKTGSLPDLLHQLVPEYFPAVPRDPFDGKEFRYSKEKKIIYSVGRDLIDQTGDNTDDNIPAKNSKDLIFEID